MFSNCTHIYACFYCNKRQTCANFQSYLSIINIRFVVKITMKSKTLHNSLSSMLKQKNKYKDNILLKCFDRQYLNYCRIIHIRRINVGAQHFKQYLSNTSFLPIGLYLLIDLSMIKLFKKNFKNLSL
jgi:hypothetical protein